MKPTITGNPIEIISFILSCIDRWGQISQRYYRCTVLMSNAVDEFIRSAAADSGREPDAIWEDILVMSKSTAARRIDQNTMIFTVCIRRGIEYPMRTFIAQRVRMNDQNAPHLVILFPNEI